MKKKITKKSIWFAILLAMIVIAAPGNKVQAASAKVKAMKAYGKFLAKHPAKDFGDKYYDASFSSDDTSYITSYFLYDMNKDRIPELITQTNVNFRWHIIRIYTYKNGKVTLCKFADGQDAVFDNNSSANGAYYFFVCKKGHFHNTYSGGMEDSEYIYKGTKKAVKLLMSRSEVKIMYPSMLTIKKGEKTISSVQYSKYTKNCSEKKMTSYSNNKKNRKILKKGKAKVSK